jgi:hypothetical protein
MEAQLEDLDFVIHESCPQRRGPQTVLIEVELVDAEELCHIAELTWVFDPANRIAQTLPEATLQALASREDWPPRDDVPRRRFAPESMTYGPDRGGGSERGLWSYDGYRRDEAWLFDGEHWWYLPTREYAPYLAHPDATFLRYPQAARQLLVPATVPLPPLQARAATLASGRLPLRASVAGPASWAYVNVSPELAHRIAASLATPLEQLP